MSISTLPFDTNKGAKIEANFVRLHLKCAKKDFILENDNYKLTKSFSWSSSTCGDTVLSFGFSDFEVQKTYSGESGFLDFLKDFKDGSHKFTIKDFDVDTPQLKQNSIEWIELNYDITGSKDMIKLLDKTPYNLPKKVTGVR